MDHRHGPISLEGVVIEYRHLLETVEKHKGEHVRWQDKAEAQVKALENKLNLIELSLAGTFGKVVGISIVGGPLAGVLTALLLKWLEKHL